MIFPGAAQFGLGSVRGLIAVYNLKPGRVGALLSGKRVIPDLAANFARDDKKHQMVVSGFEVEQKVVSFESKIFIRKHLNTHAQQD
ncbi:hypothetical protein PSH90_12065 [Pseudomonas sp. FP1762]|uniref:hypothetical protein n=1 Tax=Pseudomonas sp. FP1762 TaxID=2954080 RepID=UPI0027358A8B|nr:hypothetical protein [Pseudomonas sp. FP1762]WLG64800.1 hypothetical protein PSH90_12065 [Pseudomonas sp. FP1762]